MALGNTIREPIPRQKAYLLRLWETRSVPPDEPTTWHFSLENLANEERHGFATLEALVAYLDRETEKGVPG